MSPNQIRGMAKAPFHPFSVRTGSGESYLIAHPELYWLDPDGEVLPVKDKGDVVLIDVESINECVRPGKPRPAKRKGAE